MVISSQYDDFFLSRWSVYFYEGNSIIGIPLQKINNLSTENCVSKNCNFVGDCSTTYFLQNTIVGNVL